MLKQLMVRKDFRVRSSTECHPNVAQSSFVVRLFRHNKPLHARAAVKSFENSERIGVFEKAVSPTLLKITVNVDSSKTFGGQADHSYQPSTVLVLFRS